MVHVLTSVVVSPIAVISKVIKMLVCAVVIIFSVFYFILFIFSASLPKLNQFNHTEICFVLHHSTGKQM